MVDAWGEGERQRRDAAQRPDHDDDLDGARDRVGELLGVDGLADVQPALECECEDGEDGADGGCFEEEGAQDAEGGAEGPGIWADDEGVELDWKAYYEK